jgi:hypothetical protein
MNQSGRLQTIVVVWKDRFHAHLMAICDRRKDAFRCSGDFATQRNGTAILMGAQGQNDPWND